MTVKMVARSLLALLALAGSSSADWRMSCSVTQEGRIDSIASQGKVASQAGKIAGASCKLALYISRSVGCEKISLVETDKWESPGCAHLFLSSCSYDIEIHTFSEIHQSATFPRQSVAKR